MTANTQTTYRGLIDDAAQLLYNASDTPRIDAEVLLQHVLQQPLTWLIAYGDSLASAEHIESFYQLLEQRQHGQPIAYLVGHKEFWSLSLKVSPDVLIPRPDTETLVEQALVLLKGCEQPDILDLGTGSGAIALALAKEIPSARVMAIDTEAAALDVARENVISCELNNVQLMQSDWFKQLGSSRFDLITSNPPYIETDDPHLSQGDLRFEPNIALVSEGDGLADLRTITQQAIKYLKPGGHLIVEHGFNQSAQVAQLFRMAGFNNIKQYKDLNNLPRCTAGRASI